MGYLKGLIIFISFIHRNFGSQQSINRIPTNPKIFISKRIVLEHAIEPAIIIVEEGIIRDIKTYRFEEEKNAILREYEYSDIEDFGSLVLMPGGIDTHVHVNEPGHTAWEGFTSATKAAAAGGISTIFDMPLNSLPVTTTVAHLRQKVRVARSQLFVDVGFWGGCVPGNEDELVPLVQTGVIGFKCFLGPSGIKEFPFVVEKDVRKILSAVNNTNTLLAFHAEFEGYRIRGDYSNYNTYLKSKPQVLESGAIEMVERLCNENNNRCHIVHLSASKALGVIRRAKSRNPNFTVETCPHYLHFSSEYILANATEFKCSPPIRDSQNKEKLWRALKEGLIDMVVSDHSPSILDLKKGDFSTAWGGISSVQFTLSAVWTEMKSRGLTIMDLTRMISKGPARVLQLQNRKGILKPGMDADFVVWNPDIAFKITRSMMHQKNKITPYLGQKLFGKIYATFVRGHNVFREGNFSSQPLGNALLDKNFLHSIDNI